MQPIEKVLAHLPSHKRSGKGFKACCPAHEDRNPSLAISEADDGTVLLNCFAGCAADEVVAALGLDMADLFPAQQEPSRPTSKREVLPAYSTIQDAIRAYGFGEPDRQWIYTDASGGEVGRTLRWQAPDGKEIRPLCRVPGGWRRAAMAEPKPLFNLPALLADPKSPVYIVEGEKCVDVLTDFGLLATTSAGGSQMARLTDWTPLAGRRVIVLPDNDEAGLKYANDIRSILGTLDATVSLCELNGRPPAGGDVADVLNQCTCDDDRTGLREEIAMLPDHLEPLPPPAAAARHQAPSQYQPFRVSALPKPVAAFVSECAAATGCDPAFVALPVLTFLGAAIGNTRRLHVKSTYQAPAILWTGIVGESGTGKTPALRAALSAAYDHELDHQGKAEPQRFLVSDTTTEALAEIMASNPRGIFCVRDELAGWFGSIDRYTDKKGGCSADQSFLLSAHDGVPHTVDRRTGEKRHLHIPRASLWVTGGIQPGILARAMGKAEREAGLLARLLLACPPSRPHTFSEDDVTDATRTAFHALVAWLLALDGNAVVHLSPEAKRMWVAFHDRTAEESMRLTGDLAAAWSKFRDTALRIALILHLAGQDGDAVSVLTMERAIVLTEWFKHESQRVYAILSVGCAKHSERFDEELLLAWIEEHGCVTARDVARGPRRFRGSGKAEPVLKRLAARGDIQSEHRPPDAKGGPSATVYRRADNPNAAPTPTPPATQPRQTPNKIGCVAVATT
jgi:hypothetical protein